MVKICVKETDVAGNEKIEARMFSQNEKFNPLKSNNILSKIERRLYFFSTPGPGMGYQIQSLFNLICQ
jgi:hypothetical protein